MTKKLFKKIYIEITNICNLKCSFCPQTNRKFKSMKLEEIELVFDKVKDYTDYIYLHVKGEPLLHPEIINIIKLAEKNNLKVNLTTNGTLFKNIAKELGNCKALKKINFSLHCENNIPTYYEDIFDNIKYLSKDTTIVYRLWTLKDGKFDEQSTKIVNKLKEEYNLSTEIVDNIYSKNNVKINSTIYVDKDNEFRWPTLEATIKSTGYCYALKTQIAILSDGTVVPCCLDGEGIVKLGNIFDNTIQEIIESNRYINLKKSFQDRKPCEELCQKCEFKRKFQN